MATILWQGPFREHHMVFWKYCDASSYLGDADAPVQIGGHPFWFRGARILRTGIDHLMVPLFYMASIDALKTFRIFYW